MAKEDAIRLHKEANDLWERGHATEDGALLAEAAEKQRKAVEYENELGRDEREAVAAAVNGPSAPDGAAGDE